MTRQVPDVAGQEDLSKDEAARLIHELQERNKELRLLHEVTALDRDSSLSLEVLLQKLIDLLPPAWQYPEETCGRIAVGDLELKTANFRRTEWKQSAPIKTEGGASGMLEIYYLVEKPELHEGPFLEEEQSLIESLACHTAHIIDRCHQKQAFQDANQQLRASNQQLRAAEQQFRAHNQQLEATEQGLRATNQQLQAANEQLRATEQQLRANNQQLVASGEALALSEEKYRTLVEGSLQGVVIAQDGPVRLSYANAAMERLTGYSVEEILSMGPADLAGLIHPDDRERFFGNFRRRVAGESVPPIAEYLLLRKDGELVWALCQSSAIDYLDEPATLTVFVDNTERKLAEKARRESDERFRIAQDMSPEGFTILRPVRDAQDRVIDFTWIYENSASARLNGTDPQEIVGQRLLELFPGHRGSQFFKAYQQVAQSGKSLTFEAGYAGETIEKHTWFRIVVVPMAGDIAILAQDITERMQAEETARSESDSLRAVMQAAPVAILVVDPQACVIQVNRAAEQIFGFEGSSEAGRPRCGDVIGCVHRHDSPGGCGHGVACESCEVYRAIREGLSGTVTDDLETEIEVRSNGGTIRRQILLSAAPIRFADQQAVLLAAKDITDMRALHAKMAQSDRLSSMGMLAAGVAHEINNPLSYVLYNLESLTEDLPQLIRAVRGFQFQLDADGAGEAAPHLEDLAQATNPAMLEDILARFRDALGGTHRIRDIARGLGSFSRVEQGQAVPVNLMHVIDLALNMASNEIKYRARLVKDYGRIPTVLASEGRLSQVFLNLIINAIHAIDEGDVESNEIRVRTWTEHDAVFAEVRDTGSGIPPEILDKLFEPFFTTKKIGMGSGLGLAISKSIIEGYEGAISVESEVGKGTRFTVRLPVRAAEPEVVEDLAKAEQQSKVRGRILIIDDEDGIRSAMARMLREHETVQAASGTEARKLLEEDKAFDLILCDMMMPDVSGMDLHRWLRDESPTLARQLIFITGGAFTPRARDYLRKVDNLRLEKPFDVANFKKIVNDRIIMAGGMKSS